MAGRSAGAGRAVAIVVFALVAVGRTQDLLVSYVDRLEVLDASSGASKALIPLAPNVSVVSSVTSANSIATSVFVTDFSSSGSDIYFVALQGTSASARRKRVFQGTSKGDVDSIAFDTKRSALLVANNSGKAITRFFANGEGSFTNAESENLIPLNLDVKIRHIKYDSCSDRIYWISWSSSGGSQIESCAGAGGDRLQVISTDLWQPSSLAIDPWSQQLLWIDVSDGGDFRLERADLEGGNRRLLCHGKGQTPFDMVMDDTAVFWSDWKNMIVWKMEKDAPEGGQCQVSAFRRLSRARPMGMLMLIDVEAACSSFVAVTESDRLTSKTLATAQEPLLSPCHNYCLRGSCLLTAANIPVCSCPRGFGGPRCQADLCENFCFQGTCAVQDNRPLCDCPEGISGNRCQIEVPTKPSLLTPFPAASESGKSHSLLTTALSLLLMMCVFAICVMSAYIWRQVRSRRAAYLMRSSSAKRKRSFSGPRAAKQEDFDSARASGHCVLDGGDGVVIDVEDCCQMTICDKPCVEASFRKPTNRKNACTSSSEDREVLLDGDVLSFGRTGPCCT